MTSCGIFDILIFTHRRQRENEICKNKAETEKKIVKFFPPALYTLFETYEVVVVSV